MMVKRGYVVTGRRWGFESSVNLYDGQTFNGRRHSKERFESSVNLYDGQTETRPLNVSEFSLRVV